jgi:cytochrome b involved in lipid metabolism
LSEHPGGAKAIMLYAGRDATEEYSMIHPPNAIQKYAADTGELLQYLRTDPADPVVIGKVKA